MIRGIVAPPGLIERTRFGFVLQRTLSPEELRYYLLYWDKVVIPTNNIFHMGVPEENVLLETGVITRPRVNITGTVHSAAMVDVVATAQAQVAESLLADDKETDWVVHQIGSNLCLPEQFTTQLPSIRVDLNSLLPVPEADVPIIEILEFKEKRRDELQNLHQCLDDAYLEILSSPDPTLSMKAAIRHLKASIHSVNSVTSERWKKTKKFDFSADLSLDSTKIATGAAATAFAFYNAGFSMPIGAVVGGIASALRLSAKVTMSFEPAKNQLKLNYLSKAHDERIINVGANQLTGKPIDAATPDIFAEARRRLAAFRK